MRVLPTVITLVKHLSQIPSVTASAELPGEQERPNASHFLENFAFRRR